MRKQQLKCSINKKPAKTDRYTSIKSNGEDTQINEKDTVQPNFSHCCCYICGDRYSEIHPDYGYLCPTCAQFNLTKRNQVVDLSGLTALVTGGRIKIGFEVALKLLRDGARVYVSSRFANDTLLRY